MQPGSSINRDCANAHVCWTQMRQAECSTCDLRKMRSPPLRFALHSHQHNNQRRRRRNNNTHAREVSACVFNNLHTQICMNIPSIISAHKAQPSGWVDAAAAGLEKKPRSRQCSSAQTRNFTGGPTAQPPQQLCQQTKRKQ